VDDIRELREKAKYAPNSGAYKVYIIDEVHMLSCAAFNALLKTLEEPPPHVKFVFATTEPHKIPATITSRCQRFDFRRLGLEEMVRLLREVVEQEEVSAEPEALRRIARAADGSMRDALSILDQLIASCSGRLTAVGVDELLGLGFRQEVGDMARLILARDARGVLELIDKLVERGWSLPHFTEKLVEHFRNLVLVKLEVTSGGVLEVTGEELRVLEEQAEGVSLEEVMVFAKSLLELQERLRWAANSRVMLEVGLLRLLQLTPLVPVERLLSRLEALEAAVRAEEKTRSGGGLPENAEGGEHSGEEGKLLEAADPSGVRGEGFGGREELWEAIVTETARRKASLGAILGHAALVEVSETEACIGVEGVFYREQLEENRDVLAAVVGEFLPGRRLKLVEQPMGLEEKDRERAAASRKTVAQAGEGGENGRLYKHPAVEEPLVVKALDIFAGQIKDVKAASRAEEDGMFAPEFGMEEEDGFEVRLVQ